jgi:hypothetical protein
MTAPGSEQVRRLYEAAEESAAKASEALVNTGAFAELMGLVAGNIVALTKIGSDALDLFYRNLRLTSKSDITKLAQQLARNEDKLELVLQEIERLQDQLESRPRAAAK